MSFMCVSIYIYIYVCKLLLIWRLERIIAKQLKFEPRHKKRFLLSFSVRLLKCRRGAVLSGPLVFCLKGFLRPGLFNLKYLVPTHLSTNILKILSPTHLGWKFPQTNPWDHRFWLNDYQRLPGSYVPGFKLVLLGNPCNGFFKPLTIQLMTVPTIGKNHGSWSTQNPNFSKDHQAQRCQNHLSREFSV